MEGAVKTTPPTILIGFGISRLAPSIRPGGHQEASCHIWLQSQCRDCRMARLLITTSGAGQNIHTNQQSVSHSMQKLSTYVVSWTVNLVTLSDDYSSLVSRLSRMS